MFLGGREKGSVGNKWVVDITVKLDISEKIQDVIIKRKLSYTVETLHFWNQIIHWAQK